MIPTLENTIREAMTKGGVQALNLFRNPDGVFQANIGFRDRGPSKIVHHEDPAIALAKAFEFGLKRAKAKASIADQFEDLLG